MSAARAVAALLGAALVLAGCGAPGADLFVVTRSGQGPGAALTLRVADDGYVRCNGGARRRMSAQQLLLAREIERELDGDAKQRVSRPPGPNSILSYVVRLESGTVRFADTSPGISTEERKAAAFTREIAIGVCRLSR